MSQKGDSKAAVNYSSRRDRVASRLRCDEGGQDLAEYGLLAALIAVVCIAAVTALGNSLIGVWVSITSALAGLP